MNETSLLLARLIVEITNGRIQAIAVRPESGIMNDLGLDSIDYASLLIGAETELGVRVTEEDVDWASIRTVGQLAAFLESHVERNVT